jgi:precorrin-6B methylase 2
MRLVSTRCLFALLSVVLLTGLAAAPVQAEEESPDVVYVPTPNDVVSKMLKLAKVKKGDVVYDLGCGDGRIVVTAARKFGCKGIGFDINSKRIQESLANVKKYKVGKLVKIQNKNIFKVDLSKASVITMYLLPELNLKLVPQLNKMKPGSRVVTHEYSIEGYEPDQTIEFKSREDNAEHTVYLWTVPLKKTKSK